MDNSSEPEQDCNNAEEKLGNVRRPMNAFFIFCKRHRDIVREKYPHLENRSITKILGEWWANLEPSEKASYTALAKQYKEAFMKANPDFKWYKLPAPPTRTLLTRPSNSRFNQNENCITLGKLADDEQLGGLSSLINSTPIALPSTSTDCNNLHSLKMDEKGENVLKPPKKRYLLNGEFQSQINESSIENRDCQTRDACSALLELAEVCSSSISQEESSAQSFSNNPIFTSTAILDHGYSFPCTATSDKSLPTAQIFESNNNVQQDQPLDLCKNKDKTEELKETSKTITTSHQQLIDHFVDKFLCDSPVPKFYKSEIIDPTLCKMFAEKNRRIPSSKEDKNSHSAFTLSVAIESAVDKAYSRDTSNSYKSKTSDFKDLEKLPGGDNSQFNKHFKLEETAGDPKKEVHLKNKSKFKKNFFWPTTLNQDYKKETQSDKPATVHAGNLLNNSQTSKQKSEATPDCNKSKSYDNLIAFKKKSNVWGNFFKDEQHNNNSQHDSEISDSFISELSSRRSSDRSCKGKRYQALLTEGLLQSHKERKLVNNKKTLPYQYKVKSKISSSSETHTVTSPKKEKKSYGYKNKSTEAYGLGTSEFNLEEKIASLPKCSFENLNKKRKNFEEYTKQNKDNLCNMSVIGNGTSSNTENPSISSSGRYRTGNFDLEQQIAFLPKCNIEALSKKSKE